MNRRERRLSVWFFVSIFVYTFILKPQTMKKLTAIVALALTVATAAASDQNGMRGLLKSADPKVDDIFLGLKLNTRLDMIDYFDAGATTFSNDDRFNSKIRLSELSERHARFETDAPFAVDAYLLTPGRDSLVVSVISIPTGNGDAAVYVTDARSGKTLDKVKPDYTDWLRADALKVAGEGGLLAAIPFVTASATVDTADNTLTFSNTAVTVAGIDPETAALFRPRIAMRWNGKKFVIKSQSDNK